MSTDTLIALIGAVFNGILVLVTLTVVFISLGRWGQRLESKIDYVSTRLERRIDSLSTSIEVFSHWAQGFSKEVNSFLGLVVTLLHHRGALSDEELSLVMKSQAGLGDVAVEALFAKERRSRNPLTLEELQRLEGYVSRARAGQWLTEDEVRDYNQLVSVLEREKPTDPGVWPLVALGAFLAGLVIGSSGQRRS